VVAVSVTVTVAVTGTVAGTVTVTVSVAGPVTDPTPRTTTTDQRTRETASGGACRVRHCARTPSHQLMASCTMFDRAPPGECDGF